jgi:hypothetical protein
MVTITKPETIDAARVRLARKAQAEGVQLFVNRRDNRHYAASVSRPGTRYYVTLFSCTCPGFFHHGVCKHQSALLVAYGVIDLDPEPDPVGAVLPNCPRCMDAGMVDEPHARWIGGSRTGFRDTWTTPVPCPQCGEEVAAA